MSPRLPGQPAPSFVRSSGSAASTAAASALPMTTEGPALDRRARPLQDLRISVTDRCNFRCSYCMPRSEFGPGFKFLPPTEILSFEEIARVSRAFFRLGVRNPRPTGGEPLLRHHL